MLPVMDDFERAIKNNLTSEDLEGVKEGFNLIYNKFKATLEGKGLKPMNSDGDVFMLKFTRQLRMFLLQPKSKKEK